MQISNNFIILVMIMKKIVSTSFIILTFYFPAFSQLNDNFSDGDLMNKPEWENNSGYFTVNNGMLWLDAPKASGEDFITTPSRYFYDATWELRVKLNFNPTAYNFTDIYICSDESDLNYYVSGYFVRLGGKNDNIGLYRREGYPGAEVNLIEGDEKLNGSKSIDITIKASRDRSGNWQLFYSDSTSSDFHYIGKCFDNRYQVPLYFGIYCHFTSTRSNKFFYDDLKIKGDQFHDSSPPKIDTVYSLVGNKMACRFNEKISHLKADDTNNYLLQGEGHPDSVEYNPATLTSILYFQPQLNNNQTYTIGITGVSDLSGNIIEAGDYQFIYYKLAVAFPGSIAINEILADPSPPIHLPAYEYVELLNLTKNYISLSGCSFNDRIIQNLVIIPGGYALLCEKDAAKFFSGYGCPVSGMDNWNTINNEGELLILRDQEGSEIDQVDFSGSWYGDSNKKNGGWSVELINPQFRCWGKKAWLASVNDNGGTPGSKNSVCSDIVKNENKGYWDYEISGENIRLEFSDPVATGDLTKNLSMEGIQILNSNIIPDNPSVISLSLQDTLEPGHPYRLNVHDLKDCSGTYSNDTSVSIGSGLSPGFLNILMTEIMANEKPSKGLPEARYIELFNPGTSILSLAKCRLIAGNDTLLLPDKCILPHEYRVICPLPFERTELGHAIGLPDIPALNIIYGSLELLDSTGQWICQASYNSDWFSEKQSGGVSMEMIDTKNPCGRAGNWQLSLNSSGGTPGRENSVKGINPDLSGPEMDNVSAIDSSRILIRFSEPVSVENLFTRNFKINDRNIIDRFSCPDLDKMICHLNTQLDPATTYRLDAENVTDCAGNLIRNPISEGFSLPSKADSLDLVINEILFNPFPGGVDYIEIYNQSEKYIDIDQWHFANQYSDDSSTYSYLSSIPFILKPGAFLAFTTDKNRTVNDYPQCNSENIVEINKLPVMNNDAGEIILYSADDRIIDKFSYTQDMQFSLFNDVNGVSLERINPDGPSNDPANWHSASAQSGFGTPGKMNSVSTPDSILSNNIHIEPKVFFPNNPGVSDFTKIYYNFNKPGYVGNLRIFDINGSLVRFLAKNVSLSTSGAFIWYGKKENGSIAATGYYIISFEVYNPDGTEKTFLDKVAIGTHF